jgi:cytochrome c553
MAPLSIHPEDLMRRCFLSISVTAALATAHASVVAAQAPKVVAATPEAAGEYLMILGSCHDCHTPNWTESKGKVSKDSLMTGRALGFKGPWGTVYSKNLRSIAARQSEDHWVHVMKTQDDGDGNLPMPWHNAALMSEDDLRAMWKYLHALGTATGERIPKNTKPGVDAKDGQFVDLTTKTAGAAEPPKKP